MTDVPVKAILRLVQYLDADERKHFEAKWESGEDVSNHIFNYVRAVSDWLDGQPGILQPSASGNAWRRSRKPLRGLVWPWMEILRTSGAPVTRRK